MPMHTSHVRAAVLFVISLAAGCGQAVMPPRGSSSSPVSAKVLPAEPDESHRFPVRIRLVNDSRSDVLLFRPLDGSEYCRHLPHYRFEVIDVGGRMLEPDIECGISGLWADTTWPASYVIKLRPGESFEKKMDPPQITEPGTYKIHFAYEYRVDEDAQESFPTPPGAWVGLAEAPEVVVTFPATRTGE
jgi:hypothetical protein